MNERLELHPKAVEEARAARLWYEARSPVAADAGFPFLRPFAVVIDS